MNRRQALKLALASGAVMLLGAHTPYQQWVVYRKKHLLIGCHRRDMRTYEIAQRVVAELEAHLPKARARVARGPDARRIASLMGTGQLDVAVLGAGEAVAMRDGTGPFGPYGAISMRLLAPVGDRLLVCRADLPDRHAWLVTAALMESVALFVPAGLARPALAWHPGSRGALAGDPMPAAMPD